VAESDGARQCVPAGDKEESCSHIAGAAELEFAAHEKNTMLAPEDNSRLARLLVAVRPGEVD